jgi:hypothetical protein
MKSQKYSTQLCDLVEKCHQHIEEKNSILALQYAVQVAEASVSSIEETPLKDFLTDTEGRLELVLFTVNSSDQIKASKKIAQDILIYFSDWDNR